MNNTEIFEGYFINIIHDLYYGLNYIGVFKTHKEAREYINKNKSTFGSYDEINIIKIPYVIYNNEIHGLFENTKCELKNENNE